MTHTITPSSVFVVSGGAKGITAECVIRLARHYRCKFILLGRSQLNGAEPTWAQGITDGVALKKQIMLDIQAQGQKPTPKAVNKIYKGILSQREIEQTLSAVNQAGGQAEYLSVDITDAHQLQQHLPAITQRLGQITGLIHGAGALADKLIEKKTGQDFDLVYNTKVDGLQSLLEAIPPSQLTHLVLFSSVAGFFGNVGQADYAMANETLNKAAYLLKQNHPNCHVVSINWGPWDGGMVTPEIKKAFADRAISIIPIPVGAKILVDELQQPNQAVQIVVGNGNMGPEPYLGSTLRSHRLHRRLSESANPFLVDHKIGEHAVLPTTCAVAWLANLCEQRYPSYQTVKIESFRVTKGIVFDDTLADDYIVDLQELTKSNDEVLFEGKISSQDKTTGRPRYHYLAQLLLRKAPEIAPTVYSTDLKADKPISGSTLYAQKALFHGPLFQGVEQVLNLSQTHLTMACRLPVLSDYQQGQFPVQTVNPYLLDIMLQSMVIWVGQFHQAGSLPLELKQVEFFKPLPFDESFYVALTVRNSTDLNLVADINALNAQGEIYARLTSAKVTISKRLNRLTGMR